VDPARSFSGGDEAGFVREDDCLHSVAEMQLHQDPADVAFRCLLGDEQFVTDLGVGHAAGDQPQDLEFSGSQLAQTLGCTGRRGRRDANSAIRRLVIDGASSASPAATTRTAWTSSPPGASLSRKPLAPARSASYT
jgi:hypothetical protein